MDRHPVDLFSLVSGAVVLGLGLLLFSGGLTDLPLEWVGPAVAIGLGVLLIVAARPPRQRNEESEDESAA